MALFHDEDLDGQLDRGAFGVPTEGFGFSNDAAAPLRAPDYDAASFRIRADTRIAVTVRYGL